MEKGNRTGELPKRLWEHLRLLLLPIVVTSFLVIHFLRKKSWRKLDVLYSFRVWLLELTFLACVCKGGSTTGKNLSFFNKGLLCFCPDCSVRCAVLPRKAVHNVGMAHMQ